MSTKQENFCADLSEHPNILIRQYQHTDFQAIASIYNESIAAGNSTMDCQFYTAEDMEVLANKFGDRETILVAERESCVIGWGIIKRYSPRLGYRVCCEISIYFSLGETGKGYGSILQTALLKKVDEFCYHHVVAKILACNQGSIDFHKRFGFEVVGVQKEIGFFKGRWHDMVIMQLVLSHILPYRPEL